MNEVEEDKLSTFTIQRLLRRIKDLKEKHVKPIQNIANKHDLKIEEHIVFSTKFTRQANQDLKTIEKKNVGFS